MKTPFIGYRNSASKVYRAMYIENVTELAFDDITPEDPDFPFIQGDPWNLLFFIIITLMMLVKVMD